MNKKIFFILALVSLCACTHTKINQLSIAGSCDVTPDRSQGILETPYWFKYENDRHLVLFIAANHGPENENQATFKLIRTAFKKYSFNRVVVESLKSEWGVSSVRYLDEIKMGRRAYGEPALTVTEAVSRGIEFIGGEASDRELLALLQEKGFSQRDLAGFYLLRSWRAYGSTLVKAVISSEFPISGQFYGEADFREWFHSLTGSVLEKDINPRWSRPFQNRNDKLQALTNEITWLRDRHLAKVIRESLKSKGRLLIVYGASHADPQTCYLFEEFKAAPIIGQSL